MAKNINDDLNRFYDTQDLKSTITVSSYKPHSGHCYSTHPPLAILGTPHVIYGGSCIHPVVVDADIYIGFDHGMQFRPVPYPWQARTMNKPEHDFLFEVQDMSIPKSATDFRDLVTWTSAMLVEGKKVHCGCIGGHGRTGTFLSALVCEMTGEKDAISYVRENYCPKAVETTSQIKFLADHFGIKPIGGSKVPIFVDKSKDKKSKGKQAASFEEDDFQRIASIAGFSIWD